MFDQFWDELQPIAHWRLDDYQARVSTGYARMKNARVVICGLTRNTSRYLPQTIQRIEALGEQFQDYRVVIYENDSIDNTLSMLTDWERHNPNVTILSEERHDPVNPMMRCPSRGDRMARYRNVYRQYIAEHFSDFDYGIVVDTDLPGGWSLEGIANSFGHSRWDFMASNGIIRKQCFLNQKEFQYDAWAFRQDEDFEPLSTKYVNHLSWNRGEPLVSVTSAFGGLGIYRMPALVECEYRGGDCEHVALHRQMKERGMNRLYLNPSQVVYYGQKYSRVWRWVRSTQNQTASLQELVKTNLAHEKQLVNN
ncbi:MAG: glycosyltransferase family 2 protein [Planctomycetaceae bacterium]|nr:glycosyltransferase family 2 protein [Planctomycetaceae bacterium]